ncbi:MAG: NAD(P)H-dependent glycerol-3-phosphate dehydrogenase [Fusobacteriota bacterium]
MSPKNKIVVMGAGSWGTTLAILLAKKGNDVTLWEYMPEVAEKLKKDRENKTYLKGVKFPDNLKVTNNTENLLSDVNYLVFSVPSQYLRNIVKLVASQMREELTIVDTGKGIEIDTQKRLSQVIEDEIEEKYHNNIVVLSGPTHAEEVAKKKPSAIVAAAKERYIAKKVQGLFSTSYFRVYSNTDIVGVELAGALKNCIAIASGVSDGMNYGDNTKAALITRGLQEMVRFGREFGANEKTFSGLSGIGDLITTCTSKHSRNRYFGEELGKGKKKDQILENMVMVAEGVPTVKAVYEIAKSRSISMPVVEGLYDIIYNEKAPEKILSKLMNRELKDEFY